ncbi:hypothetical protein H632_c5572p0, partial [Helicosporidium sp. ATCC 50920]
LLARLAPLARLGRSRRTRGFERAPGVAPAERDGGRGGRGRENCRARSLVCGRDQGGDLADGRHLSVSRVVSRRAELRRQQHAGLPVGRGALGGARVRSPGRRAAGGRVPHSVGAAGAAPPRARPADADRGHGRAGLHGQQGRGGAAPARLRLSRRLRQRAPGLGRGRGRRPPPP